MKGLDWGILTEMVCIFVVGPLAVIVLIVSVYRSGLKPKRNPIPQGRWEAKRDHIGDMWRVRWSVPDATGNYLYVRHYGGNGAVRDQMMAERNAEMFNRQCRAPWEWPGWVPAPMKKSKV